MCKNVRRISFAGDTYHVDKRMSIRAAPVAPVVNRHARKQKAELGVEQPILSSFIAAGIDATVAVEIEVEKFL